MEMNAVADLFDRNGYIDILEFINALRPEREVRTFFLFKFYSFFRF